MYGIVNGVWKSDADVTDNLVKLPDNTGWTLTTQTETEHYDVAGKLTLIATRSGYAYTLTYDTNNRLNTVTDPAGRQLTFGYNANHYITSLTTGAGAVTYYAYDTNNNLTNITYPDGKTKQYLYGELANVTTNPISGVKYTSSLTGIIDQNGARYASYWYDRSGRTIKEEHAPGLNLGIDRNTITYSDYSGNTVTDALNTPRTYTFSTVLGVPRNTKQTQPAGAGSAAAFNTQTYDTNGNTLSRKDFKGNLTCHAYDSARNLEATRIEGLAPGSTCPGNLATYTPTGAARKITTEWHPTFNKPTAIAEPLRLSVYQYDANGNTLTQSIQPTTDPTGAAGTYAVSGGAARVSTYAYNAVGQVTAVDGPRADVNDITSYTYDAHYNLVQVTNALGHTTTLGAYDANGRPGTIVNPNGLVKQLSYDARGRLVTQVSGSQQTTYYYDGVGNLVQIAMPNGAVYTYTYDAAHRLIRITDGTGNYIQYTLDAMGNRTQQKIYNSAGVLVQSKSQSFDALNRLYQDIGAYNQTSTVNYDANGNVTKVTDPLNRQSTHSYDTLDRMLTHTNPANGNTQLGYDGLNQIRSVTDPRSLTTAYTRDGLGNLTTQTSPDTGVTNSNTDAAGNVLTRTDAKGQTGSFTYDALNRVTAASYAGAGPAITVTYTYDQGANGVGHLTGMVDSTGSSAYSYDPHGRLTSESKTTHGRVYTTTYSYDAYGRLISMGYPSGRQLTYGYDMMGRQTQINSTLSGTTQTIVSNTAYAAFGGVTGFSFGNGQTYTRQHNLDGRIASYTLNGGSIAIGYDVAGQITGLGSSNYNYDVLSRLITASGQSYSYDANGNRTGLISSAGSTAYSYAASSNRLNTINASTTTNVTQDANGATLSDGSRQYSYDNRGRLTQTLTAQGAVNYEVNGVGLRVRKQAAGTDTLYFYDTAGHLIGEANTSSGVFGKEYVYLGDQLVAVAEGQSVHYIHADHLNTPRMITNTAGTVVWAWDNLDPFGNNAANENPAGQGNFSFNLRFPGQYFDKETGTHYNIMRDYDPAIGRYIESDPIGLGGGINTYGYVGENPVNAVDPYGLVEWTGTAFSVSVIAGGGGVFDIYTLRSSCVNGKQGYARVHAAGSAVGFGLVVAGGGGSITFEDNLNKVNPDIFNGAYKKVSYGIAWGGGYGGSITQLAGATSMLSGLIPSPVGGIDLSVAGAAGRAWVVDKGITNCECK